MLTASVHGAKFEPCNVSLCRFGILEGEKRNLAGRCVLDDRLGLLVSMSGEGIEYVGLRPERSMSALLLPNPKREHYFIFDTCLTSIPTGTGAAYTMSIIITLWTKSGLLLRTILIQMWWLHCVHITNKFEGLDFADLVPPSLCGYEDVLSGPRMKYGLTLPHVICMTTTSNTSSLSTPLCPDRLLASTSQQAAHDRTRHQWRS